MNNEANNALVKALRTEAGEAGDSEMIEVCNRALEGDSNARTECARVIAEARARADEDGTVL